MNARIGLALTLTACLAPGSLSPVAVAGPPGMKCSYETQECLDGMVKKLTGRGWLGIEYDNTPGPDYMRITRVVPGSPAEKSGFRAGDVMVALNGARFADNTEDECVTCTASQDVWKPGGTVEYVVERDGTELTLTATLATLPSDVMAMMIGMHMFDHVSDSSSGIDSKP